MTIKYAKTSFYTQGTNNKGGVVRCKKQSRLLNVLEERTYILMKLKASDLTGIKKHYDLLKELLKRKMG